MVNDELDFRRYVADGRKNYYLMGKKVYVVYWPLDYDISRLQEIRTELLDTAGQKF